MEEEKNPEIIFPRLKNVFLTRTIISYLSPLELMSVISFLCKGGYQTAMDCSIWKEIVYGKRKVQYSYDCEDYFESFLSSLQRGEQLNKLDFHYYFQGQELDKSILQRLQKFPNLSDLRFGQHLFTQTFISLFSKLSLEKCKHITTPLFKKLEEAHKFIKIVQQIAPNLKSLTLEDPSFDGHSLTQDLIGQISSLGIKKLRFRVHEASNKETMKKLREQLYPELEELYMVGAIPQQDTHQDALNNLLGDNGKLRKLKLRCDGHIINYSIKWQVSTLRYFFSSRLTSHYASLCKFLQNNENLEKIVIKHPLMSQNEHPPAALHLQNLVLLRHLHCGGEFTDIVLGNLPVLTSLSLKMNWAVIKLVAWEGSSLNLEYLEVKGHSDILHFSDLKLLMNFSAPKEVNITHTSQFKFDQCFPRVFSLKTSSLELINRHLECTTLRKLYYIYPQSVPEYIEDIMPKFLQIPELSSLYIDGVYVKQKSLGKIQINSAKLSSLRFRCVDKADDQILIGEECTRLTHFELLGTLNKKVTIHAPNIKYIKFQGLKVYQQLVITPMSGYTLFLSNTVVHLQKCPGMGHLVIEYNWSSDQEKLTATMDQDNYYPLLQRIVCKNLQQYSNRFFQAFSFSAPRLTEIYILFADLRLENQQGGDKIIHLTHPGLKWATLINGDYHFDGIKIDKSCKNLKLLKFRDFEIKEFKNEANVRFWSEKNLLNGKDFF